MKKIKPARIKETKAVLRQQVYELGADKIHLCNIRDMLKNELAEAQKTINSYDIDRRHAYGLADKSWKYYEAEHKDGIELARKLLRIPYWIRFLFGAV